MKLQKILFLFSILGVLLLLIFAQNTQKENQGKISSIQYSQNKITIKLQDKKENLVLFENKILSIKEGDTIQYTGKTETYKNQTQIIVDKIIKLQK